MGGGPVDVHEVPQGLPGGADEAFAALLSLRCLCGLNGDEGIIPVESSSDGNFPLLEVVKGLRLLIGGDE
eukprot:CAMPEP_0185762238 /NCGR_PEP_ID=MMETSP1174-20130828/21214_1 /TAXON_ID=35687 /ORGANISM="Dictyocha speculum, Strain CCMP1381" /LENGTH=69 /DNA_ID=CAMNT_0028443825 /DNA_START=1272 /DNA_END=1481 /DNA_ORIENTATION=-